MTPTTKSSIVLGAMLAIGMVLGAVLSGYIAERRMRQLAELRGPRGFVEHMEQVIDPKDGAQRDAVRPIIEAAGKRNEQIIGAAQASLKASVDQMQTELAPILDEAQRAHLKDVTERLPNPLRGRGGPGRGGPPPFGGPGGRRGGPPPPR